jgi:hypothetical protein
MFQTKAVDLNGIGILGYVHTFWVAVRSKARSVLDCSNRDRVFESHSKHGYISSFFQCCTALCRYRTRSGPIPCSRSSTKTSKGFIVSEAKSESE